VPSTAPTTWDCGAPARSPAITRIHRDGFGLIGNIRGRHRGCGDCRLVLPLIGLVLVGGILAAIVNAVIGAVILLLIIGFFSEVNRLPERFYIAAATMSFLLIRRNGLARMI